MIERVRPKRYITHNCVENCIANLCDATSKDFRPLFLYSWDFGFDKYKDTIGEKIHYHSLFDIGIERYFEISEFYLNINFSAFSKLQSDIIDHIESNHILLIMSDSFTIPWNTAYNKYHLPHTYLLSFNKKEKCISVTDSFYCQENMKIHNFAVGSIEQCYSIDIKPEPLSIEKNIELLREKYLLFLNKNIENRIYDLINDLSSDLATINSIDKLTLYPSDISYATLIRRMIYITGSRYNTISFFKYIGFSEKYVEQMSLIHEKWESLKNLFIKILITKKIQLLELASNELKLLSGLENKLCNNIIKTEGYK
ncbi:MAG: hypothetical protein GX941_09915 [Candidatus Methanofastidiosa archaeon]|nr:hypothetical protein [Candidatus Methanofastidiosa archaeon]